MQRRLLYLRVKCNNSKNCNFEKIYLKTIMLKHFTKSKCIYSHTNSNRIWHKALIIVGIYIGPRSKQSTCSLTLALFRKTRVSVNGRDTFQGRHITWENKQLSKSGLKNRSCASQAKYNQIKVLIKKYVTWWHIFRRLLKHFKDS